MDTASRQCGGCGTALDEGAAFCNQCGARAEAMAVPAPPPPPAPPEESLACGNCGQTVTSADKFCPACGAPGPAADAAARERWRAAQSPGGGVVTPPTAGGPAEAAKSAGKLILVGAVAAAVGSFLPWAEVEAGFFGSLSVSGTDGGDGYISLVLAGIAALLGYKALTSGNAPGRSGPVIVGLLTAGLFLFEIADLESRSAEAADVSDGLVTASPAIGLFAVLAGGVAMVIGGAKLPTSD